MEATVGSAFTFRQVSDSVSLFLNSESTVVGRSVALIIGVLFLWYQPFFNLGFTTYDDLGAALLRDSLATAFHSSYGDALLGGRASHLGFGLVGYVPYAFDSEIYFQAVRFVGLVLAFLSFYFFLRQWIDKPRQFPLVTCLVAIVWMPHSWEHNPITSYPLIFTLHVSLLFYAFGLYACSLRRTLGSIEKASMLIAYGLALCIYEIAIVFVCLLPVLYFTAEHQRRSIRGFLKASGPLLTIWTLWLGLYLSIRFMADSQYNGVQVGAFDLGKMWGVFYQYVAAAVPGYFFAIDAALGFSKEPSFRAFWIDFLAMLPHLYVYPLLALAVCAMLIARGSAQVQRLKRRFFGVAAVYMLWILLPQVPFALSSKYQAWVSQGSFAYVSSFYSYFGIVGLVCYGLWQFYAVIRIPIAKRLYAATCALSLLVVAVPVHYENKAVITIQKNSHFKWLRTANLKRLGLTDRSGPYILLAPYLGLSYGMIATTLDYWQRYYQRYVDPNCLVAQTPTDVMALRQQYPDAPVLYSRSILDRATYRRQLVIEELRTEALPTIMPIPGSRRSMYFPEEGPSLLKLGQLTDAAALKKRYQAQRFFAYW